MASTRKSTARRNRTTKLSCLFIMLLCSMMLTGCDRTMLRRAIDLLGHRDNSKPPVYHEYEGFSPGLRRSRVTEEFTRYHYYIAPDESMDPDPDPEIYFRQDFEGVEPLTTFDEEKYWREHPLQLDYEEGSE